MFHGIMYKNVELYMDDMIVKFKQRNKHFTLLRGFLNKIKQFRLMLNPRKCTFGITSRKLLGYMVSERGIEMGLGKVKLILDMLVPRQRKKTQAFFQEAIVHQQVHGSVK